jgi:hypothetical protein
MSDDIGKKLFNLAIDFGHRMIDKGYVQAWFSWLEGVILVGLIMAGARLSSSGFLYFVAIFSVLILFFVGLAGVEKLQEDFFPSIKGGKVVMLIGASIFNVIGLLVVMNVLLELLPVSVA